MDGIVVLPRLHANHGAGEIRQVIQCACHRTANTWDSFLSRHTGFESVFGPTTNTTTEGIDTTPSCRNTDGASNISTNADASSQSNQRGLSASRATRGVCGDMRVEAMAPESVGRLEGQEGYWQCGFGVRNSTYTVSLATITHGRWTHLHL